jgi:hypothetical protein
LPSIHGILGKNTEPALVRIAAGFGLICASKEHIEDKTLTTFCDVIANNFVALNGFEEMYGEYLTPLGAPWGKERLLECLQRGWSSHQRDQLVRALLSVYAQLPTAQSFSGRVLRVGCAYYLEAMVHLAFPEGRLAPETTIRDLNDLQRRILEAFQQYDMPSIEWNEYSPSDYRMILGFDFRSEADFLDFMSGERSAQRTKR